MLSDPLWSIVGLVAVYLVVISGMLLYYWWDMIRHPKVRQKETYLYKRDRDGEIKHDLKGK